MTVAGSSRPTLATAAGRGLQLIGRAMRLTSMSRNSPQLLPYGQATRLAVGLGVQRAARRVRQEMAESAPSTSASRTPSRAQGDASGPW